MFIQTESTPNPNTLKFLPGEPVMSKGTADFADADAATRSPLAATLFTIDGVARVFFGGEFISVTRTASSDDWSVLKPQILAAIMDHYVSGAPLMSDGADDAAPSGEDDSDVVTRIKDLLDTRVRPSVANDGGDIIFRGFDDGVVYLHMQGACSGCPSSTATLKNGIENLLRYYVPEVRSVQRVE
jgi:Fe-S cluster biogenesis protein NfuA